MFQPLLIKYFSEQELSEMKIMVIKSHMQQRKSQQHSQPQQQQHQQQPTGSAQTLMVPASQSISASIDNLPDEILLKIFSYVNFAEIFKGAAQVSKKWNTLVYDKSNWKRLNFSNWISYFSKKRNS